MRIGAFERQPQRHLEDSRVMFRQLPPLHSRLLVAREGARKTYREGVKVLALCHVDTNDRESVNEATRA